MLISMCCSISAAAAWWIALRYTRTEPRFALADTALAAAVSGAAPLLLCRAQAAVSAVPAVSAASLLNALVLLACRRTRLGDAAMACLLAQGGCSVLLRSGEAFLRLWGLWGTIPFAALTALFLAASHRLAAFFPAVGWQEQDADSPPGPGHMRWKAAHCYGIAAALCGVLTAAAAVPLTGGAAQALFRAAAGSCLYWGGILLLILVDAYRREQTAALLERQYRGEMQSFLNVIRSQRHDYNFHVQTIAGLIQEGKMEECRRYVSALEKDSTRMNELLPVRDPAIAAMIHSFRVSAGRKGIDLHLDIQDDLARVSTNVYETNKIISNLLQNAIDETAAHADRSYGIWLTILKRGEYCVIRVSNQLGGERPAAEELGRFYQQGYTTKPGHDGVGLSSIRTLAARYRGTVYTQLEGDVVHFIATIPINYAKTPEEE